jgi:hypothetical protein
MKTSHHITAVASALAAGLVLTAVPLHAQDVVKIGFASPLTGGQASYGKANQNGALMAIGELNAQQMKIGGKTVQFELMAEDDQADPKMGPVIAQSPSTPRSQALSGTSTPASRSRRPGLQRRWHPGTFRIDQRQVHASGLQDRIPADGRRWQAGKGAWRVCRQDAEAEAACGH